MSAKSLVVISPPGGIGEITAVKAAIMGNSVKWFVVRSSNAANAKVVLSQEALRDISNAGGSVELAGADAPSLLGDDAPSAIAAVIQWCAGANGLVCTMDGTAQVFKGKIDEEDPRKVWEDAIKVAAQEAGRSIGGLKVVVLPAGGEDDADGDEEEGGVGSIIKSIIGKKSASIPSSLESAVAAGGSAIKLRHGELFGIPESSVSLYCAQSFSYCSVVVILMFDTVECSPTFRPWSVVHAKMQSCVRNIPCVQFALIHPYQFRAIRASGHGRLDMPLARQLH